MIKNTLVELIEIPIASNGEVKAGSFELKNDDYNYVEGISANTVSNQTADVEDFKLDGTDVLFKKGVSVEDVFATHPVAPVLDRFFPCSIPILKNQTLEVSLRDTTDAGDFAAHTRKIYVLLTKRE